MIISPKPSPRRSPVAMVISPETRGRSKSRGKSASRGRSKSRGKSPSRSLMTYPIGSLVRVKHGLANNDVRMVSEIYTVGPHVYYVLTNLSSFKPEEYDYMHKYLETVV